MPPDPGKQMPAEQAPKCPSPHCPSECSPEPQEQEEGETTWVSPDQPSQGDRPAACLCPSDCRPGPIPPAFWDRPEGPCWLFPSPASSPGRRLVPVCREMAAPLSSPLCSPGCGFPYGDGRKGPPNPPGASSADRLLLQRPSPGLRHPEKKGSSLHHGALLSLQATCRDLVPLGRGRGGSDHSGLHLHEMRSFMYPAELPPRARVTDATPGPLLDTGRHPAAPGT